MSAVDRGIDVTPAMRYNTTTITNDISSTNFIGPQPSPRTGSRSIIDRETVENKLTKEMATSHQSMLDDLTCGICLNIMFNVEMVILHFL